MLPPAKHITVTASSERAILWSHMRDISPFGVQYLPAGPTANIPFFFVAARLNPVEHYWLVNPVYLCGDAILEYLKPH